ncbi:MAG: diacylglycerol kinase family protein [Solirubrobacteraceae bacterium]
MSKNPGDADGLCIASLEETSSSKRRRALVIVNPYATMVSDRLRTLALRALQTRYDIEAVQTRARGHATEIASQAANDGYSVVIAFGGDGTVNEVANGLAGSPTPLSCLPGGSANVYCKLLGIPGEIVAATEHLLALADCWAPRQVDLGSVDGRYFTFCAGIGMDARVVGDVDARPQLKSRFGASFFLASTIWTFGRHYLIGAPRMTVSVEGRNVEGVTTIVQNAEHYTFFNDRPIDMAAGGGLNSGTLASVVLRRASLIGAPSLLARAVARSLTVSGHHQVATFTPTSSLAVHSSDARALPLQLDGDYIGDVTEATFTIEPGALTVVA